MARLTPEELAAFVGDSCTRHGVPAKIEDPFAMQRIAVLLRGRDDRTGAPRPAADRPAGTATNE